MTQTLRSQQELTDLLSSLKKYVLSQKLSGIRFFSPDIRKEEYEPNSVLLERVREELGDCRRCRLHEKRKHIVFGEGNPDARLVFVGEAPGADEDIQGHPFVGKAGQLLTKIVNAIQLKRSDVYIANIIKCRPPSNRDPEEDEIRTCIPFLKKQLEVIRPHIICTLGRIAAQALLVTDTGITKLRGNFCYYGDIKVMPTYHPSYLLRNQDKKKETWVDMQMVQKELGRVPK